MDFEPIETQEQFDAAIKSRQAREREKARAEFADYEELKARAERADELQKQLDAAAAEKRRKDVSPAELGGYVGAEPPLPPRMRQGRLFAFASGLYQRENPRISQMVRTWRFCRISKNKSAGSELTQHAAP
ncbi:MAG: hypothetical protein Q4B30_06450 [Coriobacteriaceae bacterium]|nr:hypothetical protein [Coriobacteriaceae bacterium]